jgi:O-acetylhomoserine (thiol)-lyase
MQQETLALHAGYEKDTQGTMAVPIYMSTAYEFRDTEHAANLFALKELGNIYTRLTNPTSAVFEKRFAEVEGGVAAVSTASGASAIFSSIMNLCEAGDNIIVSNALYGGTTTLTDHTIKRIGIETRKFDVTDPSNLEELIDEKTKLILFESLSNPNTVVADFEKIVQIANKYNIITVVDNTVATPILCQPIALGCDLVVHSTSKYTTGQGLALGGIIVEGESCNKKIIGNSKYQHFNEPDPSYHGLVYADLPFPLFSIRMVLCVLRDLGVTASPFNSWLMIQGLETLFLRMKQHSETTLKVAQFLENHPKVKKVNYPGLTTDRNHERAKKYLQGGFSGLLSFEVDTFEEAKKILDSVEIFSIVVNIGDSKSIITHPASTTHQQLSSEELNKAGIKEGLIRLSIGLENSEDLIDDLQKAMEA